LKFGLPPLFQSRNHGIETAPNPRKTGLENHSTLQLLSQCDSMLNSSTHTLALAMCHYICSIVATRQVDQVNELIDICIYSYYSMVSEHTTNSTVALSLFLRVSHFLSLTLSSRYAGFFATSVAGNTLHCHCSAVNRFVSWCLARRDCGCPHC